MITFIIMVVTVYEFDKRIKYSDEERDLFKHEMVLRKRCDIDVEDFKHILPSEEKEEESKPESIKRMSSKEFLSHIRDI